MNNIVLKITDVIENVVKYNQFLNDLKATLELYRETSTHFFIKEHSDDFKFMYKIEKKVDDLIVMVKTLGERYLI